MKFSVVKPVLLMCSFAHRAFDRHLTHLCLAYFWANTDLMYVVDLVIFLVSISTAEHSNFLSHSAAGCPVVNSVRKVHFLWGVLLSILNNVCTRRVLVVRTGIGEPGLLSPWIQQGKWVWVSCRAQECCSHWAAICKGWRHGRCCKCCCGLLLWDQ